MKYSDYRALSHALKKKGKCFCESLSEEGGKSGFTAAKAAAKRSVFYSLMS